MSELTSNDDRAASLADRQRDGALLAMCSYLKSLELPPVSYRDEEKLLETFVEFDRARTPDARSKHWWKIRRYLRRFDGRVSNEELFAYYARRDFFAAWNKKDAAARREAIATQLNDESAYCKAPLLKNYALNLASATTSGGANRDKFERLIDVFVKNDEAAFLLSEYAAALDDYAYAEAEEVRYYCDQLTDFLRRAFLLAQESATTEENAPKDEPPRVAIARVDAGEERASSDVERVAFEQETNESDDLDNIEEDYVKKPDGYYEVSEELARRAQEANSFREYKQGSATSEYRAAVHSARAVAARQKEKVEPAFHDRIDAVLEDYERKLADWYDRFHRNAASCPSVMIVGAAKFPVEKQKTKARRVGELLREHERIAGLLSKIEGIGTAGVSSDDENAIDKLQAKRDALVVLRDQMKEANAYRRKRGSWDGYEGPLKDKAYRDGPDLYQFFNIPNVSAEIRRLEQRIELLKKTRETDYGDDVPFDGGVVRFCKDENRLQLLFDDKPDEETRSKLKGRGFRWSLKNKAWQRMITPDAIYAAKFLGYLPKDWKPNAGK